MVCNTPVIANDDIVRKEIVLPYGGLLVNCASPKKIAKAIKNFNRGLYKPAKQVKKFDDLILTTKFNDILENFRISHVGKTHPS